MSSLFDISDRAVLVTGASRGLGRIMAAGLAEHGARVFATARRLDALESLVDEVAGFSGTVVPLAAELGSEEGCAALARSLAEHADALDVLVNNAATTAATPIEEHNDEVWNEVLALNAGGVFHLTRFLLPALRTAAKSRPPARVINVGSVSGMGVSIRENWSYIASKAAVHHMTRHWALMLGPEILVNTIAPGVFRTDITEHLPPDLKASLIATTPARRMGRAADLVATVVFLSSPGSSFLTGIELPIDGGVSIRRLG